MADEKQAAQGSQTDGTTQSSQGQASQSQSTQSGTDGASSSSQGTGGNIQTSQTQQSQAPARPDGLPESFWDATTNKVKAEPLNEILARDAARQSELLTRPKSVDEYKVEPSKEFKPPEGVEFTLNQTDPQVANLKAWALRNGVPQAELSGLVDIYGGLMVSQQQIYKAAFDAEVGKLGTTGPARVDAIKTWLDAKGFGAFKPMVVTADIVKGFEKLMADMRSQGASGYTGNGRDNGANDGKIPNYDKMSFEQRRHAQEQRRNGAR